jgi:hypothetical protein
MERIRLYRLGFLNDRNCDKLAIERWASEDQDKLFESTFWAKLRYIKECIFKVLGYGENPFVFFWISFMTILIFSVLFLFSGFEYNTILVDRELSIDFSQFGETVDDIGASLYVSVVTFSTLGYGDVHPIGISRMFACIEALLGLVFMSSFVATFLKRLLRD